MPYPTADDLDALILEEKKRVAVEFFNEAWSSAAAEGIEPQILAESALSNALTRLTEAEGDAPVSHLVDALPDRLAWGHFLPNRSIQ